MPYKKMKTLKDTVSAKEYLDELNQNIFNGIDAAEIYSDDKVAEYNVTEEECIFLLPDNYLENRSMVDVYINEIEQNDYSIQEKNFVNCIVLNAAVNNVTIKIRCRNFKYGFLKFLQSKLSMG